MDRNDATGFDVQWVALCARRLRDRWPRADPTSLEEAAAAIWNDATLRAFPPGEAAARWLAPLETAVPPRGAQAER